MNRPKFILVCGMSACGKSTYARKYATDHNYVYISPDTISATIHDNPVAYEDKFEVWMMVYRTLHLMELKGKSVVLDSNCLHASDREQLTRWFPSFEHHMIYIMAKRDFRLKHNATRDRNIPEPALLEMERILEVPEARELEFWHSITYIENSEDEPFKVLARKD